MHFHVVVRPGWRDGREIRIGALGTNRLQSVVFVVRELRHPYFSRPRDKTSADVLVRFALTKEQHEAGAIVSVPTLTGRPLKLSIKANSAVAANGGDKRIANEGFPIVREDHQTSSSPPYPPGTSHGDMIVKLRVQGTIETWLRRGKRMWYAKALGYTVGGVGVVYVSLGLLAFALDIEGCRTGRQRRIPDVLLLSEAAAVAMGVWATEATVAFEELKLAKPLLKATRELGWERPTPIQARVIPFVLSGCSRIQFPKESAAAKPTPSIAALALLGQLLFNGRATLHILCACLLVCSGVLGRHLHAGEAQREHRAAV